MAARDTVRNRQGRLSPFLCAVVYRSMATQDGKRAVALCAAERHPDGRLAARVDGHFGAPVHRRQPRRAAILVESADSTAPQGASPHNFGTCKDDLKVSP